MATLHFLVHMPLVLVTNLGTLLTHLSRLTDAAKMLLIENKSLGKLQGSYRP